VDQLVFLDESAINKRSLDRKHGWAPVGQFARLVTSIKRIEKWSILPLYTIDGFLAVEIIKGSYNSFLFRRYMQEIVIPNCTPYPGPQSVVVMDNARIHCDPVISLYFSLISRRLRKYVNHLGSRLHTCRPILLIRIPLRKHLYNLKLSVESIVSCQRLWRWMTLSVWD
jgi:hypothetical protein